MCVSCWQDVCGVAAVACQHVSVLHVRRLHLAVLRGESTAAHYILAKVTRTYSANNLCRTYQNWCELQYEFVQTSFTTYISEGLIIILITSIRSSLVKGHIAVMSALAAASGFIIFWLPSNMWFLAPTWVSTPNDISIGSAVFAGLTHVTNTLTNRQTQAMLCSNRPHLCTVCMRCGLIITVISLIHNSYTDFYLTIVSNILQFFHRQEKTSFTVWTYSSYGWGGGCEPNTVWTPTGALEKTSSVWPHLTWSCWRQEMQFRIDLSGECWWCVLMLGYSVVTL